MDEVPDKYPYFLISCINAFLLFFSLLLCNAMHVRLVVPLSFWPGLPSPCGSILVSPIVVVDLLCLAWHGLPPHPRPVTSAVSPPVIHRRVPGNWLFGVAQDANQQTKEHNREAQAGRQPDDTSAAPDSETIHSRGVAIEEETKARRQT